MASFLRRFNMVWLFIGILFAEHDLSPPEIIDKIVQALWSSESHCAHPMFYYNYGGAVLFDSMLKAMEQFSDTKHNYATNIVLNYTSLVSPVLNHYLFTDTTSAAYVLTHDPTPEQISSLCANTPYTSPSNTAIGDCIGLFPITYLHQLLFIYRTTNDTQVFNFTGKYATEWQLIFATADEYILRYPYRLNDAYRTVSRVSGGLWSQKGDANGSFVWADDSFLGVTLLTRLTQALHICDELITNHCNGINVRSNITKYVRFVYDQSVGFSTHLIYDESKYNGLYAHAYNDVTKEHSCCPWSRANAWIMGAHMEVIQMYLALDDVEYNEEYKEMVQLYQNQVNEIASLQDMETGLWHQVVNESSTFLETSGSTGFLFGILQGFIYDVLPMNVYTQNEWKEKIGLGWKGLLSVVDCETGLISDACTGTAILNKVEQYQNISTDYCLIGGPGDAAFVLYAISAYQQYKNIENEGSETNGVDKTLVIALIAGGAALFIIVILICSIYTWRHRKNQKVEDRYNEFKNEEKDTQ
eukprot:190620_1